MIDSDDITVVAMCFALAVLVVLLTWEKWT
jgi:energy-coupling factor transporter transmembrane protein EcfT